MKRYFLIISMFLICTGLYAQSDNGFPVGKAYAYDYNGTTIITDSNRAPGFSYKVQVMRIPFYDQKDPGLTTLKKYGSLNVEHWQQGDDYVLLIGSFKNKMQAESVRNKLKKDGFKEAQIIEYRDGLRS